MFGNAIKTTFQTGYMMQTKVMKIGGTTLTRETKPSVIDQLKTISATLQDLVYYEWDVAGSDITDAIFYSTIQDQIDEKIKEMEID